MYWCLTISMVWQWVKNAKLIIGSHYLHRTLRNKKETDKKYLLQERESGSLWVGRMETLSSESLHSKIRNLGLQMLFSFHTALPNSSLLHDCWDCLHKSTPNRVYKMSLRAYHVTLSAKIPLLFIPSYLFSWTFSQGLANLGWTPFLELILRPNCLRALWHTCFWVHLLLLLLPQDGVRESYLLTLWDAPGVYTGSLFSRSFLFSQCRVDIFSCLSFSRLLSPKHCLQGPWRTSRNLLSNLPSFMHRLRGSELKTARWVWPPENYTVVDYINAK